jgi:hypothetical protein
MELEKGEEDKNVELGEVRRRK